MCVHRRRALAWVRQQHAGHTWPVIIGLHDQGSWCKALAVADALSQTDADVLVICDADVWSDNLAPAVASVMDGAAWALPHRSVHRLTEAATTRLLDGEDWHHLDLAEAPYGGTIGGGITVIRRDLYDECPLDPRFTGWGGEDECHGIAVRALYGAPWRPVAHSPLLHLWHPPQDRATRAFGSAEGRELRKRYIRAASHPTAMLDLIEEAKAHDPYGPAEPAGNDHPQVRVG